MRNPYLLAREINKLYYTNYKNNSAYGTDIFDEDWDNLIILDACRYDVFKGENYLPGQLQKRVSKASSTVGFLRQNFDGGRFHDTVYVTANPQLTWKSDFFETEFHSVANVWTSSWDEDVQSVTPQTMERHGKKANERFPNKRLILHFLQPHFPFIGEYGKSNFETGFASGFWTRVKEGDVSVPKETIWEAYRENLAVVLPSVEALLETLPGTTIVTSDHGQAFGERSFPLPIREYGHPRETFMPCLTDVPWLVYDSGREKHVEAEPPAEAHRDMGRQYDTEQVESRLKQLGYKM
ncbi:hypothetical protein [Haladaptatus caseinilyticus]|uniref:hypothetical protein n=1 Tax=Haladaptatus caseinilyticus TaxID=2993314 RepID=UPI00224A6E67|nr:hypothetical protein [Haladaptatus caseinilyticus]